MLDDQKMLAEQRRGVILEELGRAGSVSVADLSRRLKVSDMTIRRDLEELSGRRLLRKVHGGAVPLPKAAAEPHFEQKRKLSRPEKIAIARAAQGSIDDGDTVAFSAGTTTWHVAAALQPGHKDLTFVTNSTHHAEHRRGRDRQLPNRGGAEGGRGRRQLQARRRGAGQDHPALQG